MKLRVDLGGGQPIRNDCSAATPFDSAGHNLLSSLFLCDGFDAPGDLMRSRVRIATLADNGGPTKTIALRRRSPAINAAKPGKVPGVTNAGESAGESRTSGLTSKTR